MPGRGRLATLIVGLILVLVATLSPLGGGAAAALPPRWCVRCGGLWLTDAISNVALFVPLGFALALNRENARGLWGASVTMPTLIASGISLLVESSQAFGFPPGRSPALADVLANTIGGLLGAVFWRISGQVMAPSRRAARWSCAIWALGASTTILLTSLALLPRASDVPVRVAPVLQASPFGHVPGQPFFRGIIDSALVFTSAPVTGTYRVRRGWPSPVITEVAQEPSAFGVDVFIRGREMEPFAVPMVFLHRRGETSPVLQINSRGDALTMSVSRRATDWGLVLPGVELPAVFSGRRADDPRPVHVWARVTQDSLRLGARGATMTSPDYAALGLVPTLGWSMIQSIVSVDSPLAPVVTIAWLCFLLCPVAYWGCKAGMRWLIGGVTLVGVTLASTPLTFGTAPVPPSEWATILAGVISAVCAAWWNGSTRS